jgi:hypothetical protein
VKEKVFEENGEVAGSSRIGICLLTKLMEWVVMVKTAVQIMTTLTTVVEVVVVVVVVVMMMMLTNESLLKLWLLVLGSVMHQQRVHCLRVLANAWDLFGHVRLELEQEVSRCHCLGTTPVVAITLLLPPSLPHLNR